MSDEMLYVVGGIIIGLLILTVAYKIVTSVIIQSQKQSALANLNTLHNNMESVCLQELDNSMVTRLNIPEYVRVIYATDDTQNPPATVVSSIKGVKNSTGRNLCLQFKQEQGLRCFESTCNISMPFIGSLDVESDLQLMVNKILGRPVVKDYSLNLLKTKYGVNITISISAQATLPPSTSTSLQQPSPSYTCGSVGIAGCPTNACLAKKPSKNGVNYPHCNNKIKITETDPRIKESCDSPICMYGFIHDASMPNLDVYDTSTETRNKLKQEIESQLVDVQFLGLTMQVNKKVSGLLKDVENDLEKYRVSGSRYNFPSGSYTFDSSGSYNFRHMISSSVLSAHSFGLALDLNAETNFGNYNNNNCQINIPPEAVEAFEKRGFRWGGRYSPSFDPMHFEYIPSCLVS